MDLQHRITEALEEHVAVIHQLTAMSHLILQVAGEVVATESAKLWGDSGMLGGAYRIGGTQHRVTWA
jgi:hypothetical protein